MANRNNNGNRKNSVRDSQDHSGKQNQGRSANMSKSQHSGANKIKGQGTVAGSTGTGDQGRAGQVQQGGNH